MNESEINGKEGRTEQCSFHGERGKERRGGGRCGSGVQWTREHALQPGALEGSASEHCATPPDHPEPEQQDLRGEERFMFWVTPPQKTPVICAAAGGHADVRDPW